MMKLGLTFTVLSLTAVGVACSSASPPSSLSSHDSTDPSGSSSSSTSSSGGSSGDGSSSSSSSSSSGSTSSSSTSSSSGSSGTSSSSGSSGTSSSSGSSGTSTSSSSSSGSSGSSSGGTTPTWSQLYSNYMSCTGSGCHTSSRSGIKCDNKTDCFNTLTSAGYLDGTASPPLIDPAQSCLTYFGGPGGNMPPGGGTSMKAQADFKAWAAAGAANN